MTTQTEKPKHKKSHTKRTLVIIAIVIAVLVAIRFILPPFLLNYTNKVLSEMKGYKGHIEGFDLEVINLGLIVKGFKIERIDEEKKIPVPFISADEVDTFIEWKSLLHGAIVGRLIIIKPNLNFVKGPTKATTQTGTEGDWTTSLKKLKTYTINKVELKDGTVTYNDFYSKPQVKLFIHNLQLTVTNLKNIVDKKKKLPSHLELTGTSIGNGDLEITGDLNILKKMPDFDAKVKFTKVDLTALNDFTRAYADFDFDRGQFSLYAEAAADNSYLKGYVRPLLEKIKVYNKEQDKHKNILKKMWEATIGTVFQVTKNQSKDRFATEIPFEGNIKKIKTEIIPTILHVFKNEFIKVYPKSFDPSANVEPVEGDKTKKSTNHKKENK